MATAQQISTRALKRLGVVPAGATPAAADVSDAVAELNGMIASWEGKGLAGDVLPLDARFENAVVDMLAYRISDQFGVTPSERRRDDARDGWATIQAAFFPIPDSRFDSALIYTGHQSDIGYIIGDLGDTHAPWRANTPYALRAVVEYEGNVYECIEAGTSGASVGPSGTGAEIADGTAYWCWRRVSG